MKKQCYLYTLLCLKPEACRIVLNQNRIRQSIYGDSRLSILQKKVADLNIINLWKAHHLDSNDFINFFTEFN